jgi:prepilin-type N-terminal cleavage/methylation domain-containing protein/prepilin-type processing-associated H-X9-DG protein
MQNDECRVQNERRGADANPHSPFCVHHSAFCISARAFTLVELLVVIGIISVLIAILMPALTRARMSADLVKCEANFKQIYNAVSIYANESKGTLPRSSSLDPGTWGTFEQTFIRLSEIMGTKVNDANIDSLNPVFSCVYADTTGKLVWAPNIVRTVQFHPRAFPGYDQQKDATMNREFPQRKIATIRNAADKVMFYEGPQLPIWNMTSEPESIFLDGWRWNWGHMYADPPADGDVSRWDQPIDSGLNRDDGWWVCSMRFRHLKNTTTPVAFFDGHVEARRKGDVKVREICISR